MSEIGLLFNKISNKIKREIDKQTSTLGISSIQGRVILYIFKNSKNKDIFQKDIEDEFELRGASVSSLIQNMEKNDLITRESVKMDQRLKKIVLTDKAIKIHLSIRKIIDAIEADVFQVLDSQERADLISYLEKVLVYIEKF